HRRRLWMIVEELLHRQQVRRHPNSSRVRIASGDGLQDGLVFPVRGEYGTLFGDCAPEPSADRSAGEGLDQGLQRRISGRVSDDTAQRDVGLDERTEAIIAR